ncbi:hypothetical protein MMC26_003770 [Xylographa opegraphella]|nr:hypothetical protein [Xylographa opegraphella]
MRHPPVLPWSLRPEHCATAARKGNKPALGQVVEIVPERHRAWQQQVLGTSDQPDRERRCGPLDGSVTRYGEGGGVVVGGRRGMERLTSALPSVPDPRQDAPIREFCEWVQRWGKPKVPPRPPGQSMRSAQRETHTPAAMVDTTGAHREWIHITQENYRQLCNGSCQTMRPPVKLEDSIAHRPHIPNANRRANASSIVHRPLGKNFMDLPLELREFVYSYIFADIRWGHPSRRSRKGSRRDTYALAILRLSKNIRTEAQSYFLERMEWDFVADNRGIDHLKRMATAPETSLRNIWRANLIVEANATRVNGQVGIRLNGALLYMSSLRYIRVEIQHSRRSHYAARDHNKDLQDRLRDRCFERYLLGSLQEHLLDVLPPGWVTHKPQGRRPQNLSLISLRKYSTE